MKQAITKEIIIYFVMLVVLAILMHGADLPRRMTVLPLSKAWHPFVYTLVIYLLVGAIRLSINKAKKMFSKQKIES